jgi:predicted membrane-bound spermidine synthase
MPLSIPTKEAPLVATGSPPARSLPRLLGPALAFTTAALLMLEVALTRILSVVMWYHFAFFTISVALFGLAASGLTVYLLPRRFRAEQSLAQAALAALVLAVAVPLCFALFAANPAQAFVTGILQRAGATGLGLVPLLQVAALYLSAVVPFFIGGLVGAVVFRHYGDASSRLYFWDLVGAGLGCLATVPLLDWVGGPTTMAGVSLLAAISAALFAIAARSPRRLALAVAAALAAVTLLALNPTHGWLHLRYFRGREENDIRFEKWNSFSRVAVRDLGTPDSLLIEIDAASNTVISRWNGDPARLAPLRDGLIAVAYVVERRPDVFVIGSGGGVDLLTAVAANAESVTAVEVNPIIVDLMMNRYAAFSGGIYHHPIVTVVNDEARSYLRRSKQKWDVIQAGYIDTYAATAAGAFSLTENTLYTREAYEDYLEHLTDNGIVSIQRYYEEPPQQSIRLVSLALAALEKRGASDPAGHVIVVRQGNRASVLVKRTPFTPVDVSLIEQHCRQAHLELVAAPGRPGIGLYGRLLAGTGWRKVIAEYPYDITPVTDDRPFFFYVIKPTSFWRGLWLHTGEFVNARAVFLLTSLLLVAAVLSVLMLAAPALVQRQRLPLHAIPAMGYFGALGLGFMLVEIGMLQRLMLFLGQPALALSVVLATLLVSAGLGAAWTRRVVLTHSQAVLQRLLALVLVVIAVVALAWPGVFHALVGLERPGRILVTVMALAPVGMLLGTAMPLGLRRLANGRAELIPWAWGVNGATSVLGSVLAMVVAIHSGFTITLLLGAASYVAALALAPATGVREITP